MKTSGNPSPGFARNPGKSISVAPYDGTVTVRSGDKVIATSARAKLLTEAPYPPVLYVPFGDIDFGALEKTTTSTHCPYKGDASYWSVKDGAKDAMWAYESPFDEMAEIKDHGAFYPDRVTVEAR
jgi:uncharacterized protein (DUF427 family)